MRSSQPGGLTSRKAVLKYRKFRRNLLLRLDVGDLPVFMTSKSNPSTQNIKFKPPCKHPRVQIVSRDEDSEFVECKECGEIFESSEFKDMNIEDSKDESEL